MSNTSSQSRSKLIPKTYFYGIIVGLLVLFIFISGSIIFSIWIELDADPGFSLLLLNLLLIVNIVLMQKGFSQNLRKYRLKLKSSIDKSEIIDYEEQLEEKTAEYKKTYFLQMIPMTILLLTFGAFIYYFNIFTRLFRIFIMIILLFTMSRYSSDPLEIAHGEDFDVFNRSFESGTALEFSHSRDDDMGYM